MSQHTNIVFAGTPEFSVPPLQRLLQTGWRVSAVYTQPDRPAGRGQKSRPGPVKAFALDAGLPVFQPSTLRDPEAQAELAALRPDIMVVVAYGLILPQPVLDIPPRGCINIHASLLPRWRGAAPIQRALLTGDSVTGVTLMQMEAGLDTGPILASRSCPIEPADTAGDLHDRLAVLGADLLVDVLPELITGRVTPIPQDPRQACYAEKLSKEEARLDWHRSAVDLERQIKAFNPWPIAQTRLGETVLRIWSAKALTDEGGSPPGLILAAGKEGIDVATGHGILRLLCLQAPGGKPLAASDYLNGHIVTIGARFG
jgi:methionyl-tRNA formyltransferase